MSKLFIAFLLGTAAGILDTIPMLIQNMDPYATASAFMHWVILGMLLPFIQTNIKGWLKGLVLAEVTIIPILLLVMKTEPASLLPIILFSAVLGSLLGFFSAKYAE